MHALFTLGIAAFVLCLGLTPLCRDIFLRAGLVDKPDSQRKFHLRAVPRVGGIPIALSYMGALGLVLWLNPGGARVYVQHHALFHALLPAAGIIFITGLMDDVISLRPWQKLLGQLLAACTAVGLGVHLSIFPRHPSVSTVLSVVWLIGCSNAVNLIDGMDGLATGVGLLATLTTLLVALLSGNTGLALATIPLAGALLAFLRYNFSPATVFLGDCGSLTIGFVLGCFGLAWTQHSSTILGLLAPLMMLALPLVDVVLAIGRRFLRAVPIFQGDRGHIHHRVQALGFSTRNTALLLYAVCGVAASLAILESFSGREAILPIMLLFVVLVLAGIRRLQYVEFSAARKTLSHTLFRRVVQDHIYLEELELELRNARNADEWWEVVRATSSKLAFASVFLELDMRTFSEAFEDHNGNPGCRIHIGLGRRGFLELTRQEASTSPADTMTVLHRIQSSLDDNPRIFGTRRTVADKSIVSSAA